MTLPITEIIPGATVRLVGWRGVFRIHKLRDDGFVDVWGGTALRFGMRTVEAKNLKPSLKGDVVPGFPRGYLQVLRKATR